MHPIRNPLTTPHLAWLAEIASLAQPSRLGVYAAAGQPVLPPDTTGTLACGWPCNPLDAATLLYVCSRIAASLAPVRRCAAGVHHSLAACLARNAARFSIGPQAGRRGAPKSMSSRALRPPPLASHV